MTRLEPGLLVSCPYCRAEPGEPCRTTHRIAGVEPYLLAYPHVERTQAAR